MSVEPRVLIISASAEAWVPPEESGAAADPALRAVARAVSGEDGLELFFRLSPDVVLLDIALPDANGFRILDQIRAATATCVVVILGASPDKLILDTCSLFGATAFFCRTAERIPVGRILLRLQPGRSWENIVVDPGEPEIAPGAFVRLNWP